MILFRSVWAVVLRYLWVWRQDWNVLLVGICWPLLDVLVWGFLGAWISKTQDSQFHNYEMMALLGVLLWQIVGRGCNIISNNTFEEELRSNNLPNWFALPLGIVEWIFGVILFGAIVISLTTGFCTLVAIYLYSLPVWTVLSMISICALPLFLSAIWLGFTCMQALVTFGKRGVEIGYVFAWFMLPFSGAYYPIEVLPAWGQTISKFLPMSYVFQGMRSYLTCQQDPTSYLIKGYAFSFLYAISAILIFVYCFNRSKQKGLARLLD